MIALHAVLLGNENCRFAARDGEQRWLSVVVSTAMLFLSWCFITAESSLEAGDDDDVVQNANEVTFVVRAEEVDRATVGVMPDAADHIRQRMMAAARSEIVQIDRRCSLLPEQKRKLELASRGDVVLLFERLCELRQKSTARPMTPFEHSQFWVRLQDLRWAMDSGMFSETSLFHKTLRNSLTAKQLVEYRKLDRERGMKIIEVLYSRLEDTTASQLSGDCRRKLMDLMADKARSPQSSGPYAATDTWLEAAQFQDQLRPLMRDRQWRSFQEAIRDAQGRKQFHQKSELWPYDDATKDESAELPEKSVEKQEDKS